MKPESQPLISSQGQDATTTERIKKRSVLPPLVILVISFAFVIIGISYHDGVIETKSDALLLMLAPLLQTMWAFVIFHVGKKHQMFLRQGVLQSYPIFWLPFIPVALLMAVFSLRWNLVMDMVDHFPRTVFVSLQAVRVLAVGSLIKWKMGLFPAAFAWGTAFPDMLFGLSAVFLLLFQSHKEYPINSFFLLVWNLTGFMIILPVGVTILQLGMTPTKLYESRVSNDVIFEYPMVLGPAMVVPTLLCWNAIVVAWALSQI